MAAFLDDTGVLVYAYHRGDADEAIRARACLRRLGVARNGVVSAQVLGEFVVAVTRRVQPTLSAQTAEHVAMNLSRSWPVYDVTGRSRA